MAKTRSGFVSNSSSSSFIVAARGEIDRDRIIEILGVPVCPGGVPEDGTGEAVEIRVMEESK